MDHLNFEFSMLQKVFSQCNKITMNGISVKKFAISMKAIDLSSGAAVSGEQEVLYMWGDPHEDQSEAEEQEEEDPWSASESEEEGDD